MNDGANVPNFGKPNRGAVQPPHLGMWLAQTEDVLSLALPTRRPCQPPKEALPRIVEFGKEMAGRVAGNICHPWDFRAKASQLTHLIVGRRIALVGSRQPHKPLLVGEVPQEPERRLPREETRFLRGRRVGAIPEALVDEHAMIIVESGGNAIGFGGAPHKNRMAVKIEVGSHCANERTTQ